MNFDIDKIDQKRIFLIFLNIALREKFGSAFMSF